VPHEDCFVSWGARGTRIHYTLTGDRGPHVVLLHGLGLSARFWFDLPERLANDDAHPWRVVAVDNRGTGKSDRPRPPYRMEEMADDVAAVLDDAKVASAYVVGISLGGMIAQHVALRHPERVDGLVLLATTPGLPHGRLPGARQLGALLSLAVARRDGPSPALARLLLPESRLGRAKEIFARWPAAMRADPTSTSAFLGQLAAAARHSTGFRLRKIRCPAVVVTGEEDILIPPHNSRLLARKIPRAELEVLADVGHGIPLVDEDVVRRSLARLRR
jgi:pimeloyl-ACP methyl ester carboxylesterase